MSEEEAEACVNLMDRDGDGKVVFDEVKEWWTGSSNIFRSPPCLARHPQSSLKCARVACRFTDEKFVIAQVQ